MSAHIGIAACSAEGAALCYRTICTEGAQLLGAAHAHPEVSMHTPSLAATMNLIYRGDWQGVAEVMLESAHKLAKMGADFLICPDNTLHQALPYVVPRSPRPWLHIADAVMAEANRLPYGLAAFGFTNNAQRVNLLGERLEAGMIGLNSFQISVPESPFGGVKESGHGSEEGIEGLEACLVTKFISQS